MQPRALLPTVLLAAALLAGCAQQEVPDTAQAATSETAAALFAQAAANMPDHFAVRLEVTKSAETLMSGQALVDKTTERSYLAAQLSDDVATSMERSAPYGFMDLRSIAVYVTPEAAVAFMGDRAMIRAHANEVERAMEKEESFAALADPGAFFGEMAASAFTVKTVAPDTVRDRAATKVEATFDADGVQTPVTVWLFQEPTRVARVSMPAPSDNIVDPLRGATMTIDILYEGEIDVEVPGGFVRALGLRFESNVQPFAPGSDPEADEVVWTFAADGGIPLTEVTLELDGTPLLVLSALTAQRDGVTATYTDADGDGLVSAGDTLRVTGAQQSQLALHDTVSGLRIVPGAGLLLAALALAGVALLARRR